MATKLQQHPLFALSPMVRGGFVVPAASGDDQVIAVHTIAFLDVIERDDFTEVVALTEPYDPQAGEWGRTVLARFDDTERRGWICVRELLTAISRDSANVVYGGTP